MARMEDAPVYDPDLDDRYVRCDTEMMAKVNEYNARYLHWADLSYRIDVDKDRIAVWNVMKGIRLGMSVDVNIGGLKMSICMPDCVSETLYYLDRKALDAIETRLPDGGSKRFTTSSLMEEAIASSQIEGAAVTRMDAKRMLRSGTKPRNHDELMIMNNYLAMERLKEIVDEDLSIPLILDLHSTMTSGTLRDGAQWEGRFRDDDSVVVGNPIEDDEVYHVPPSHREVPAMMEDLCRFANTDSEQFLHPIVKAIILHYMIGFIHPFIDGNGRIARTLFYWYCLKNGYRIFEFTSISSDIYRHRGAYAKAYQYTEHDGGDLTYFVMFNLKCIRRSIDELQAYMKRKSEEGRGALELLRDDTGLNAIEASILYDHIQESVLFSIKEIEKRYGVVYQTARKYVMHLEDLGYVKQVLKDRKKRLYMVDTENARGAIGPYLRLGGGRSS